MKKLWMLSLLMLLAGCFTSVAPKIAYWNLNYTGSALAETPQYGVARISQVAVRSPYNRSELSVLLKDGSLAFDNFNQFAALPQLLFKGMALDAAAKSGIFSSAVGATSSARSELSIEVSVTEFYLDCKVAGERTAKVALELRLMADKELKGVLMGVGEAKADAGDYGRAFSLASSQALDNAFKGLIK